MGIVAVLAVVIIGFVGFVATRPSEFRIARSAIIDAPPEIVFAQVNDLHNWEEWSPWAKLDPDAQNTFEGPTEGTGARFSWSGNKKVGEGRMTITESQPYELVRLKLEFVRPFKDTNTSEFSFTPQADRTAVTWSMHGHQKFVGKAFAVFVNIDKMLGASFEQGLTQLRNLSESLVHRS